MSNDFILGMKYYNGEDGYEEDVKAAIFYFQRALDLYKEYEAAYQIGICYCDELQDEEMARKYMEIADYHWVDDATEWLAEYHSKKNDIKVYFDYALDTKRYLKDNQTTMIKKLDAYYDSVFKQDYVLVEDTIELLESWFKRIKDKSSPLCKRIATHRNNLLRSLCELLIQLAYDTDVKNDINEFLNKYINDSKLQFVKEYHDKAEFINLTSGIYNSQSLEELKQFVDVINNLQDPWKNNATRQYKNKTIILLIGKDDLTDLELSRIRDYFSAEGVEPYYKLAAINALTDAVDKALTKDNFNYATRLYTVLAPLDATRFKILAEISVAQKKHDETLSAIKQEDQYNQLITDFYKYPTQISFNKCFSMAWSLKKNDDLRPLALMAKKHKLSFNHIRGLYGYDFYKKIISKMPAEFFQDDVQRIKMEIEQRHIKQLVHFTPKENINSINTNGLLSRELISKNGIKAKITDDNRYDGLKNHISLSITSKNYKMFWKKIFDNVVTNGFEIYIINPSILYEHPEKIIYCSCNASSLHSINHMNYGIDGLLNMFVSEDGLIITGNNPADVQAEVLFEGRIGKEYIINHYQGEDLYYGQESSVHRHRY